MLHILERQETVFCGLMLLRLEDIIISIYSSTFFIFIFFIIIKNIMTFIIALLPYSAGGACLSLLLHASEH